MKTPTFVDERTWEEFFARLCESVFFVSIGRIVTYLAHPSHMRGRVWDRGALVALRPEDREDYVRVCDSVLAPGGRILLATMVYDQSAKKGADEFFFLFKNLCLAQKSQYSFESQPGVDIGRCRVQSVGLAASMQPSKECELNRSI